jgi:hypothetical protein
MELVSVLSREGDVIAPIENLGQSRFDPLSSVKADPLDRSERSTRLADVR